MFAWRDNYISYNGGGAAPPSGDPYWNYVTFLQNNETPITTPLDSSTNQIQIHKILNARITYNSPFATGNYGSSRSTIDAVSQYQFPSSAISSMSPGSQNFTVECYALIPSFPANNTELFAINTTLASSGQATCRIVVTSGGGVYFLANGSTSGWINTSTAPAGTITAGTWNHYAAVRNGTSFRLYINGVSKLSYTFSGSVYYEPTLGLTTINNLPVGMGFTGASNCFVTMARYVVGTAVYTGTSTTAPNFTPPTSPVTAIAGTQLLLNFESINISGLSNNGYAVSSPTIQDQSIVGTYTAQGGVYYSNYTPFNYVTYPGSIYSPGAYLQSPTPTLSNHTYGTGNFTIEGWFRFISPTGTQTLIDQRTATSNQIVPVLYASGTSIRYQVNGIDVITGTSIIVANTWYHIAISKVSGSTKLFINGVQDGTTYTDSNNYTVSRIHIGSNPTYSNAFNGYYTNIRLSKGIGYYTSNFTPSTTPLPNDNLYTVFYINGTNGGFQNLSNNSNTYIATVSGSNSNNTPQLMLSQKQKKFGIQSQYYKLSGASAFQYVTDITGSNLVFGTGDFTIEFWMYRDTSNIGSGTTIMSKGTTTTGWKINITTGNQLALNFTGSVVLTGSTTLTSNTWYFVALSRVSNVFYLFVNGISQGTYTGVVDFTQTNSMIIGADPNQANGFSGYLDDIRVTKGVGRYTSTCPVPTETFPTS